MGTNWPRGSYPLDYPTLHNTPQPPKKGMPLWGILLLAIGVPVIVSCVACGTLYALAPKLPSPSIQATVELTSTPTIALPAPSHIQIGSSVVDENGVLSVKEAKTTFSGNESFAWVFTSDTKIDPSDVYAWTLTDQTHKKFAAGGGAITIPSPTYQLSGSYPTLSTYLPTKGIYCVVVAHVLDQQGQACFSYTP